MVEVRWTEGALAKLEAIAEYIARDDPAAARKVTQRIWNTALRLGKLPRTGYPVPGPPGEEVRQVWVGVAHKRQQSAPESNR